MFKVIPIWYEANNHAYGYMNNMSSQIMIILGYADMQM